MPPRANKPFWLVAIGVIVVGQFVWDIVTPNGIADWIWYFLPVYLSVQVGNRYFAYWLVAVISLLMLAALYLSAPGIDFNLALTGRLIGMCAIWLMAVLIAHHKDAEKNLERTQRELQRAQALARIGNWSHDIQRDVVTWSDEMYQIFGVTPATFEPTLAGLHRLIHPEDLPVQLEAVKAFAAGNEFKPYQYRVVRPDGEIRVVQVFQANLELNAAQRPIRVSGAVQDITERKQTEAALLESASQIKASQRIAKLGTYVLDVASGTWRSSDLLDEIFGIGPDYERSIAGWENLIHPADRAMMVDHFQNEVLVQKMPFNQQYRILRQYDQAERWVHGLGRVEFDAQGRPVKMIGTVQDITKSKRAMELMVASEIRYRRLFETAQDGILILNAETGRVTDVNPFLMALLGYMHEEILGKKVWELGFLKDVIANEANFAELQAKEYIRYENLALATRDGRRIEVEFVSNVYQVNGRKVIQCNIRDITQRKQAENALREALQFSQSTIDALTKQICVLDHQGVILATNRAWNHFEPASLNHHCQFGPAVNYLDVCDRTTGPEALDAQAFAAGIRAVISGEQEFFSLEYSCHSAPEERWFIGSVTRFREPMPARVVICHENITDRKHAKESQMRLATAVEQATDTIVITDTTGAIIYCNPAFEKSTGYTRAEVIGQNPRLLKSGKMDGAFYRQMWETLLSGQVWTGRLINKRKDGGLYEEDATITPIRNAAGETTHFVAVKRDVTHEVELEGQMRQSQKMQAIGTLAGGIAHDFNNILTILFGYCNLLQFDVAGNVPAQEKLREILKAGQRAQDLVQQILTFSRQREQERQVIHLEGIIKEAMKLLRASLPAEIQIETSLSPATPTVLADATQIYQVMMNLGTNALHAMEGKPGKLTVKMEAFQPDEELLQTQPDLRAIRYARLTVTDTGHGMDARTQERIFEPFFTTKPIGKGTGLGLAVVHGIIEAHDGVVTVASQPGQGTTFQLYFPEHTQELMFTGIPDDKMPCGHGQKILVVDDDPALTGIYQRLLKMLKYEATVANHPREAVARVQRNPAQFDLVITDLTMPEMNGLEVARQIRALRADLPIVLATGYKATVTERQLHTAGICELMDKPVSLMVLAAVLRKVLGKK